MNVISYLSRFFLILLIFSSLGCVVRGPDEYSNMWAEQISNYVALYDPDDVALCQDVECWAMVCKNTTNLWRTEQSFVGGSCHFENLAGETPIENIAERYVRARERFNTLMFDQEQTLESVRPFMVSAGPTFNDFGEANRWCNNGMKMAVQWHVGTELRPYSGVDPGRAICFLDKGIMPMYVLYSGGHIDRYNQDEYLDRTEEIAHSLGNDGASLLAGRLDGPVGPVIITTEMEADLSDDRIYEYVVDQIQTIKAADNCPNQGDDVHCFVAVGVKMGDYDGVQRILEDDRVNGDVDLIAFGMNSQYADSCDQHKVYTDTWNFSRYIWHEYGKQTVIPYILFDSQGIVYNEEGDPVCEWSESEMQEGYANFFPNINAFAESGTIGAAIYDFNSTRFGMRSNPLECEDCAIGKDTERLATWFTGCQRYTVINRINEDPDNPEPTRSGGGVPLVFPSSSGGRCSFAYQDDSIINTPYGSTDWRDFGSPITSELDPPLLDEAVIRCDTCINEWSGWPGRGIGISRLSPENTETACTAYPELDDWAGRRGLDPVFVRALAWHESRMNPCSVSCVARPDLSESEEHGATTSVGGRNCWSGEVAKYSAGYNFMEDPAGECDLGTQPSPGTPGARANFRWLAVGLMQLMNSPYTFWPADTDDNYCDGAEEQGANPACGIYGDHFRDAVLTRAGGSGSQRRTADIPEAAIGECSPVFNPFNTTHSACMGTYIFAEKLRAASGFVASNSRLLQPANPSEEKLLEYYIATWMYTGNWDSVGPFVEWATEFSTTTRLTDRYCEENYEEGFLPRECRLVNGEPVLKPCYGVDDFITYVHECKARGNDPGYNKLSVYRYLNTQCHQYSGMRCPSWRNTQEELGGIAVPSCGNPYLCPEPDPPPADDEVEPEPPDEDDVAILPEP